MKEKVDAQQEKMPQFYLCFMENQEFLGRLMDFTSHARLRGPCGDSMEFYLVIDQDIIKDVKCYTDGCGPTKACAVVAASLIAGKPIQQALKISAGDILERLGDLPENHRHCSILAVSTLYHAIAEYLLKY
ncbi:MAG: iron-sulfur cluster assembly scaffold protein [Candidatus Omnitrophica bacterium]|nr:iron-sulfur cluster assembly scaffold protein [Candidatus Omnitrophota bacterium]